MDRDLDRLQGAWTVTVLEMEGQTTPASMLAEARIVIKGDRFTTTGMGAEYGGTFVVDESSTPRRLDMKFDAGPERGATNLCIYELDGDRWKLCIATRGTVRPNAFVSPAGSGFAVETLTRGGAPKKARRTRKAGPATELEGEWRMVSGVMDGKPMDASTVQWVKRVTRGNQTTVTAGPQTLMEFYFAIDAARSPASIDYTHTAGANKGKTQLGIYQLNGDRLTIFVAAPGAGRPEQFEAAPDKNGTLTVWKRA
jgi:uncharacterized protein (TIGR03067 family)